MECTECHNPHKMVIWDGEGITKTGGTCHTGQMATTNHTARTTCIDCHMPFTAKSGTTLGQSGYKSDVRSHLLKIIPDTAFMFSAGGSVVRNDEERPAALSPHFTCLGCRNDDPDDDIPDQTIEAAVLAAPNMHQMPSPTFVGSQSCNLCHSDKYSDWVESGHPYKFNAIATRRDISDCFTER